MDTRTTFTGLGELYGLLSTLRDKKQEAALLVDKNGLTRVNGIIVTIKGSPASGDAVVTLDNQEEILIKQIVAVNGTFSSDYTEC